jgi:hypothetical protein
MTGRKKAIALFVLLLFFVAYSLAETAIQTDRDVYELGDLVRIKVDYSNPTNLSLSIRTTEVIYEFNGDLSRSIIFKPRSTGIYEIVLARNAEILAAKNISVQSSQREVASASVDSYNRQYNITKKLQLDKDRYTLGEAVHVSILGSFESVQIIHQQKTYEFFGPNNKIVFVPRLPGPYVVESVIDGNLVDEPFIVNMRANVTFNTTNATHFNNTSANKTATNNTQAHNFTASRLIDIRDRHGKKINAFVNNSQNILSEIQDVQLILQNTSIQGISFHALNVSPGLVFRLDEVNSTFNLGGARQLKKVFAIDAAALHFSNATITAIASANALYKCKDWDFSAATCLGQWERVMLLTPGKPYSFTMTATDPGFGEANITIINVQSYPQVGGEWTVRFNTTGTADLIINPVNGTTWDGPEPDLAFLSLKCGDSDVQYAWINSSVVVYNYSCYSNGYETSTVLTSGKHYLRFIFGDDVEYAKNYATGAALILFYNGTTVPSGWVCISCTTSDPFYGRLPRGNRTYGSIGGQKNHTHTINLVSHAAGAAQDVGTGGGAKSSAAHVHPTISSTSVSTVANIPLYKALKVIRYNNGVPTVIPEGAIAIFNTSTLPSGWTRYSAQDNRFVLANASPTQMGGANNHTHSISYTLDLSTNTQTSGGTSTTIFVATSGHTHYVSGTSNPSDNRPPYVRVILARANANTSIPRGMIAMFNATPAYQEWTNFSGPGNPFYGKFFVGSSSYGTTGGNSTHKQPNTVLVSGVPSASTDDTGSGVSQADDQHTHNVTVSFTTTVQLPPYINVILAYSRFSRGPPNISQNSPRANYRNTTATYIKMTFNCSIKDDYNSKNISLYLTNNKNQSFKLNSSCQISGNSSCRWQFNLSVGNYTWNCLGYDLTDMPDWGTNRTIRINRTLSMAPVVTLVAPKNASFLPSPIQFSYNFTNTTRLDLCQLWGNFSGTWKKNMTHDPPTMGTNTFSALGLKDGSYKWNVYCNVSGGQGAFAPRNYTLRVDSTLPYIRYAGGTAVNDTFWNRDYIFVNVSASDLNEKNITFYLYNATKLINATTKTAGSRSVNFTSLNSNRVYFYNVTIRDKAGNSNTTVRRKITLDTTLPFVSYRGGTAANNTFANRNYIFINVSASDANEKNITFNLYNSTRLLNSTTKPAGSRSINFTNLNSNKWYYYNVSIVDKAGNRNTTVRRKITLDNLQPSIRYAGGTAGNDTYWNRNYIFINVSASDLNEKNITFYLYNATHLINSTTKVAGSRSVNFTGLNSNKIYFYNVTIRDKAGFTNSTVRRKITLDTVLPFVSYRGGTAPNNTFSSLNYVFINVSAFDLNEKNITFNLYNSTGWKNSSTKIAGTRSFNFTNLDHNQVYFYNVSVVDNAGNRNTTVRRKITLDNVPPYIRYAGGTAVNDTYWNRDYVYINVSASDISEKNITFYLYNATHLINSTTKVAGSRSMNFTKLTANKVYFYNVTIRDKAGFTNSTVRRKINLDLPPFIAYAGGTSPNNTFATRNYVYINVTASDANEKNITFNLYNSTKLINSTTKVAGTRSINFTNLNTNKWYFYNVSIVDKAGNRNTTVRRKITLDNLQPSIRYAGGTAGNNTFWIRNYVYINVSASDLNEKNITFYLYNATHLINSTTKVAGSRSVNFTGLNSNKIYFYNVTIRDKAGFTNSTVRRKITLDTIQPRIAYAGGTSPNNTFATTNYIYINVTASDANEKNITFNLYNSTKLINSTTKVAGTRSINFTNLNPNKWYFYNVSIVDKAGSRNTTVRRQITFDNLQPSIRYTGGTASNDTYWSRNYIYINVSASDLNEKNITFYLYNSTNLINTTTKVAGSRNMNFTKLNSNKVYFYNVTIRDKAGFTNSTVRRKITLDTIQPRIAYAGGTSPNNTFATTNYIYINVTASDANEKNITFNLYNSTKLINSTTKVAGTRSINFTNLNPNKWYFYNVSIVDKAGSRNTTVRRKITLDNVAPLVKLLVPPKNSIVTTALQFNYTSTDLNLDVCELWGNFSGTWKKNQTDISPQNQGVNSFATITLGDGFYKWNVRCNDSAKLYGWNNTNFTFRVAIPPSINKVRVRPNMTGYGMLINITANITDNSGIDKAYVFITNPGSQTTSYQMTNKAYSYFAWSSGLYTYFIWANDTKGNEINTSAAPGKFNVSTRLALSVRTVNITYKSRRYVNLTNATSASWWNTSFSYRQRINVTVASGSTYRNFQILIRLNSTNTGANFDWSNSCNDIRFVNSTNKALIPFWVELCDSTNKNASIWVKVDANITTSGKLIYIYYGNGNAKSRSNGNDTFEIFDDFEDGAINLREWDTFGSGVTETGGYATAFTDNNGWKGIRSRNNVSRNSIIEAAFKVVGDRGGQATQFFGFYDMSVASPSDSSSTALPASTRHSGYGEGWCDDWGTCAEQADGSTREGAYVNFGGDPGKPNEVFFPFGLANYTAAGSSFFLRFSNGSIYKGRFTTNTPSVNMDALLGVQDHDASYGGIYLYVYWVRVRKSDSPEPRSTLNVEEKYRKGTMLENTGKTNSSGYLLMQVAYLNNTWHQIATQLNDSKTSTLRTVRANKTLNIAPFWNANPWNTDSLDLGTYRIYASLTDKAGNTLKNDDGTNITGNYTFTVDYLRIKIQSPTNKSVVDATGFWANLSLSYLSYKSGGWCFYSIDAQANRMMKNDTATHFYNLTPNVSVFRHNITFYCNDTQKDITTSDTIYFNATDKTGPVVRLMYPLDAHEVANGNITFYYNVTDVVSGVKNCTLEFDFANDKTNTTIKENKKINFTKRNIPNGGPYYWRVFCYDTSAAHNRGNSTYWTVIVGFDTDAPVVNLKEPENEKTTSNNDVLFRYRVYDATTGIKNCTLILNGKANQTKTDIKQQGSFPYVYNNFTLNNLINRTYKWSVNCSDTSAAHNRGGSDTWNFTIYTDSDAPKIILMSPDDKYTSTSSSVVFYYNVTDYSSGIKNCSIFLNGRRNQTSTTVTEGTPQNFQINSLVDGRSYNWSVQCIDDSFQKNKNMTKNRSLSIYVMSDFVVNVTTDNSTYEQGTQANESFCITTKVKDKAKNPQNASVSTYIIMGNTSASWWNSSWPYRQPIRLNVSYGSTYKSFQVNLRLNANKVRGNFNWSRNCTDLRFANELATPLPLWIENCDIARQNASIWVKVDQNLTTSGYTIYMYYGKSGVAKQSMPSSVFDLYDDFDDAIFNTSRWEDQWGGVVETDGYLYAATDDQGWRGVRSKKNFSLNSILEFEFRNVGRKDQYATHYFGFYDKDAANPTSPSSWSLPNTTRHSGFGKGWCAPTLWSTCAEQANGTRGEGAYIGFGGKTEMPGDNYFKFAQINYTSNGTGIYISNATNGRYSAKFTRFKPKVNMDVFFAVEDHYTYNTNAQTMYIYWARVRKYAAGHIGYGYQSEEKLINKTFNSSIGTAGKWTFCYSSSSLNRTWFTVVSYASASKYNPAINYSRFRLVTDITDPLVYLISPPNDNISYYSTISLFYNVTDKLSGIRNCSLVLNKKLNLTNSSIIENQPMKFRLVNLRNGWYNWTVNCTDDSLNRNKGTAVKRQFRIAEDSTPPKVYLRNPKNGYNDTNGNVVLFFNVTDDIMSTADCGLYLNKKWNVTKTGLAAAGKQQNFTMTNLQNGRFEWYVNCSDTSTARNYNSSKARNFSVTIDVSGPSIWLKYPANYQQLTNENVTFKYNVTDYISNVTSCSFYFNGKLNKTNTSIIEGKTLNFSFKRLNGWYNWSIGCTDGSENSNFNMTAQWTVLVAPDTQGPTIRLTFPPNKIELYPGVVVFFYNVSDVSAVNNCTLYLNKSRNVTKKNIQKDVKQNLTTTLGNGYYQWFINCTDGSPNHNYAISERRNLTIGEDKTPPTITLVWPQPQYNDTNGNLALTYQVIDYASGISNCSLILDNKRNMTNKTVVENTNQKFTIYGLQNAFYSWRVNCSDNSTSHNKGSSALWNFTVIIDIVGPTVTLISPPDKTTDTDGNRIFFYNVTDAISGIKNCSLVLNRKVNVTNTSRIIKGKTMNFTKVGLSNGNYNWSVNCTDSSDNKNRKGSETRLLTVVKDSTAPTIYLVLPANGTKDSDGNRTFYYNVTDSQNNISYCRLKVGSLSYYNYSVKQSITQSFRVVGLTTGNYRWNVTCVDTSDNSNSATTSSRTLIVLIDISKPVILLKSPKNNTQNISNKVAFYYNVSDISPIANCSLIFNGTINGTKSQIVRNVTLNFTFNSMRNGTYVWRVNCTDTSELRLTGTSEPRLFIVGPDVTDPTVKLMNPPSGSQDTDGNITFEYNVTDFASGIANCSLIFDAKLNKTTYNPIKNKKLNFTLTGAPGGNHTWRVNCTDNSPRKNRGSSELWYINVGIDTVPPIVTLVSPGNRTLYNSKDVAFQYSVYDYASSIRNCSLIINYRLNMTNTSVQESVPQYFYLYNLADGNYSWSVNCTDTSVHPNTANSGTFKVTVFRPRPILADVYTNQTSYELGRVALVVANTTNASGKPFDSYVFVDIMRGNGTAPWWSTSWKYRLPVDINSTNFTRHSSLIEQQINFTNILANETQNSTLRFDINSVRVIEWVGNKSREVPSQFENASGFNKSRNAFGIVRWLLNGTTLPNTVRRYYIYFDVEQSGSKSAATYSSYRPSFSVRSGAKSLRLDGALQTADSFTITYGDDSFAVQLGNGQDISNQQNIQFQGAGSLWNISVNHTRLTNYYDALIPFAIYSNYFLNANRTSIVKSGPVVSRINIPGYVNGSAGSKADLNYTVWFTGTEINVRANLYVQFSQANNDPASYFNNLWFAYLFDYGSSWTSYVHRMNSSIFNQTHNFHAPSTMRDTTNKFSQGRWYSEYWQGVGSLNLFTQSFLLNGGSGTVGMVSYDDYYNLALGKTTESDGAGLNFNQDKTIAANDRYNLTVWMVFSKNDSYQRARDMQTDYTSPIKVIPRKIETFVVRQSGATGSDGIYSFTWSTVAKKIGSYSVSALANKSLYYSDVDYYLFQITKDMTPPTVQLFSPSGWLNYSSISFTYYVSDTNLIIANCSLILNNKLNKTNKTVTNAAYNYFRLQGLQNMDYNWTVNCSDAAGNIGKAAQKNISIDTYKPSINLTFPVNGIVYKQTRIDLNFTTKDNRAKNLSCSVYLNNSLVKAIIAKNGTRTNATLTLVEGAYSWYVRCVDTAGNRNTSTTKTFYLDQPPIILLRLPTQNSWDSDGLVVFNFTLKDNNPDDCQLWGNFSGTWKRNQTIGNPQKNTYNLFAPVNLSEGHFKWNVWCNDTSSNSAWNNTNWTFAVDKRPPTIQLNNPASGQTFNTDDILFNWTATDKMATSLTCNLTINNTVNRSYISAQSGSWRNVTVHNLSDGTHTWKVTCWDPLNHVNTSATRTFIVNPPDLRIRTSDIRFGNTNPDLNKNITVFANVSNIGGVTAHNVVVDFWDGRPGIGKYLGNRTKDVGTSWGTLFNATLNVTKGFHTVWVVVDPHKSIAELLENNNNASNNISALVSKINAPANRSKQYARNVSINFTIAAYTGKALNYTIYIDGKANSTGTAQDNVSKVVWVRFSEGTRRLVVGALDALGRAKNSSVLILYVDVTPPKVWYVTPPTPYDNQVQANTSVLIKVGHSEPNPDSIIFYWQGAARNRTAYTSGSSNFTVTNLSDGIFNYYVWLNDTFGWHNQTATRTVRIDLLAPRVYLESPRQNATLTSSVVEFSFNVSDSSVYVNCSLYINNKLNKTKKNLRTGTSQSIAQQFGDGNYYWFINCTDQLGHLNVSQKRNFTMKSVPPSWGNKWYERYTRDFKNATALINLSNSRDNILNKVNVTIGQRSLYTVVNATSPYLAAHGAYIPRGIDVNFSGVFISSGTRGFVTWKAFVTNDSGSYLIAQSGNDNATFTGNNMIYMKNTLLTLSGTAKTAKRWLLSPISKLKLVVNIFNDNNTLIYTHYWDNQSESWMMFGQFYAIGDVAVKLVKPPALMIIPPSGTYNHTCLVNCTYGICMNTIVYAQYNTSIPVNTTWANISSSGRLKLRTGQANPVFLGNLTGTMNVTFVINGTTPSTNNIRCFATTIYNKAYSNTRVVMVNDTIPPVVRLDNPKNGTARNTTGIVFYFNVSENIALRNCSLYINGVLNQTKNNSRLRNNAPNNFTLITIKEGVLQWKVRCIDTNGNRGNSSTWIITMDRTKPFIRQTFPSAGYIAFSTSSLDLNFTVKDNLDKSLTCNLTLDRSVIRKGFEVPNGTISRTLATNLKEGTHFWNVTCWDNATNLNRSATRNFSNYNPPVINLISPGNNAWTNRENNTFVFYVSDETGIQNCSLLFFGKINKTKTHSQIRNNATNNLTAGKTTGIYNWSIECYDNTSQHMHQLSVNRTLKVDLVAPQPNLETKNRSWINTDVAPIFFNITDNMASVLNYTFFVDAIRNVNGTVPVAQRSSALLRSVSEGARTVLLEGTDQAGNRANSTSIVIYVDKHRPRISLNAPPSGKTFTNSSTVTFNFTAYDNMALNLTCRLSVSHGITRYNLKAINASPYNLTITNFAAGFYLWNVTCLDYANNTNTSRTRNFTIRRPDLELNASDIRFSDQRPVEKEKITINATVHNIGGSDASNVKIQIFNGDPDKGGVQLNGNFTKNISLGSYVKVSVNYTAVLGLQKIFVIVDPPLATNGSIQEESESNNKASNNISVAFWHYVMGNTTDQLVISDLSQLNLYVWNMLNDTGSNVFAADLDSNVQWASLKAIGKQLNNLTAPNDFEDIDRAMASTNFSDSVNITYRNHQLQNFTVYRKIITDVSVVSSTNNSNFRTGILWDSSDPNQGQYNGTQDLIFVTKMRYASLGYNGTHDFEIRVPAKLRDYKGSTPTVALYAELK